MVFSLRISHLFLSETKYFCCFLMCPLRFISPARWAHFQAAAKQFSADHNGEDYFSALNKVSRMFRRRCFTVTGQQIIFFFTWKDICPTKTPSWSDKTKLWLDITKNKRPLTSSNKWLMIKNCPDIMSDHNSDFVGHKQILVGQCPMTDCYLQPCS